MEMYNKIKKLHKNIYKNPASSPAKVEDRHTKVTIEAIMGELQAAYKITGSNYCIDRIEELFKELTS